MKRLLLPIFLLLILPVSAREVTSWNEGWLFSYRSEGSSDNARAVRVPHTWNTGSDTDLRTTGDYQRRFRVPQDWTDKRLFVRFYGVETVAQVFVNGKFVGEHRGGTTAFAFEITDFVRYGVENRLRVAVSNSLTEDVMPLSTVQNVYGGIHRDVEFIVTDATAISPLYLGTDGVLMRQRAAAKERAEAEVQIYLTSRGEGSARLLMEVYERGDTVAVVSKVARVRVDNNAPVTLSLAIDNPKLWSVETPNLYDIKIALDTPQSQDKVQLTTGFRDARNLPKIHGVVLHYDRIGIGNALTPTDLAEDFETVQELGANALRSPAGPHDRRLYDLCDERGVMVWMDLPFSRAPFLSDIAYLPTPSFEANGEQQLREMVAQNQHRPSVVMWGLFDCLRTRGTDPVAYVKRLNDLCHRLDPTRQTVACSNQDGPINQITDLIVWAQTIGWEGGSTDGLTLWLTQLAKKWNSLRSGIYYAVPSHPDEKKYACFHEKYVAQLQQDTVLWGVWTDLFDYGSVRRANGVETTGLVTVDRRTRKPAFQIYRDWWNASSR